jgi:hypothetical protein
VDCATVEPGPARPSGLVAATSGGARAKRTRCARSSTTAGNITISFTPFGTLGNGRRDAATWSARLNRIHAVKQEITEATEAWKRSPMVPFSLWERSWNNEATTHTVLELRRTFLPLGLLRFLLLVSASSRLKYPRLQANCVNLSGGVTLSTHWHD